jgi:transposase
VLNDHNRGAQACGYEEARWTLWRVRELIAARYGVGYPTSALAEKLHALAWSPQPVTAACERDEPLAREWLLKSRNK